MRNEAMLRAALAALCVAVGIGCQSDRGWRVAEDSEWREGGPRESAPLPPASTESAPGLTTVYFDFDAWSVNTASRELLRANAKDNRGQPRVGQAHGGGPLRRARQRGVQPRARQAPRGRGGRLPRRPRRPALASSEYELRGGPPRGAGRQRGRVALEPALDVPARGAHCESLIIFVRSRAAPRRRAGSRRRFRSAHNPSSRLYGHVGIAPTSASTIRMRSKVPSDMISSLARVAKQEACQGRKRRFRAVLRRASVAKSALGVAQNARERAAA